MRYLAECAALSAASCVAMSNLIAPAAARHFGPFGFNRWRLIAALILLAIVATLRSGWNTLSAGQAPVLIASSLIGIALGDTAIYGAMTRIGSRRTSVLYATYAPLSAILGYWLLQEQLNAMAGLGIAIVACGVSLAVYYREPSMTFAEAPGNLIVGASLALLGAFSAAAAALLLRPVMAAGTDPCAAACIRISIALIAMYVLTIVPGFRDFNRATIRMVSVSALAGALGMAMGMTLQLIALSAGKVGVVTTLASTTPVMLLPLIWLSTGHRPEWRAWTGAALAVVGISLIVLNVH
jgi:drug/metabolite transporter (DMT)-like permease